MKSLIKKDKIRQRISSLARKISRDYKGKELVLVGVLKGGFVFLADLIRQITLPLEIDFIQLASYGASTTSSGVIKVKKDIDLPIAGKDVLVVEDIVDYGYTMDYLLQFLADKKARSVKLCALLDKPARRKVKVRIDYRGFKVPDKFIVGYGLDCDEKFRNLPDIAYLEK